MDKQKKCVKWNSLLEITDISLRKKGDFVYSLLYTNINVSVCATEAQSKRLCLFEPYEMKGYVNFCKGGSYLVLEKAKLANGKDYKELY